MRLGLRFIPLLLTFISSNAVLAAPAHASSHSASLAALAEAQGLARAGRATQACAKYAESYSLEAELDALLPLAVCFEQQGKLASAYATYRDAVELAKRSGDDSRALTATEGAERLKPRLSYLTVEVPQSHRLPRLSVECDGYGLGSNSWDLPMPVDPGQHVISARAAGHRAWQTTIDVRGEGAGPVAEVPLLDELQAPAGLPAMDAMMRAQAAAAPQQPAAPRPAVAPRARMTRHEAARRQQQGLRPVRIAALAAGGVGVASLGLAAHFLARRNSTLDERDGICPAGKGCAPGTNAHLAVLTQQAISEQRASLAFFAVAGATLACGAGLWFLPRRTATSDHAMYLLPVAQPAGAALVWGGSL